MKKKIGTLVILFCLLMSVLSPALVNAQSSITVQSSSAQIDFPLKLTFNLSVSSDVNVTDIRLRYTINRQSFAKEFGESFIQFAPANAVQASWILDMQKVGGLPTGSTLNYWWVIKDAGGKRLETTPQQIDFSDNRYQWRSNSQGMITLYWYQGDDAFAKQLMTTAQQALASLERNTGASVVKTVRIYIYASAQDLQGAMIFPAEWTGGVNFFTYGIIAIGIAPSQLEWGKRAIAHELTHQIIYQATANPYNVLPNWLDEGLAVYNEGPPDPTFPALLNQAIASGQLISLRSLSSPFSAYGSEANLSYAESYSVVNYLVTTYGQAKMLELLNTFQQGSTYDGAFEKVYGFNMDKLYTLWKQKVAPQKASVLEPAKIPLLVTLRLMAKDSALGWGW